MQNAEKMLDATRQILKQRLKKLMQNNFKKYCTSKSNVVFNPLTAEPFFKKSGFTGVNSNFEMPLLAID